MRKTFKTLSLAGLLLSVFANAPLSSVHASGTGPLIQNGGQVMNSNNIIPIYWEPTTLQDGTATAVDANYNTTVNQFSQDLQSSPSYFGNIISQYWDNTTGHAKNSFVSNSPIIDTSAYPTSGCLHNTSTNCLSESQIQYKVKAIAAAHFLTPIGLTYSFVVYTSKGENTEYAVTNGGTTSYKQSYNDFCAYHNSFIDNGKNFIFAQIPYPTANSGLNCLNNPQNPNGVNIDNAINMTSKELFGMVTNPDPQNALGTGKAWLSADGNEIGDLCNNIYPSPLPYTSAGTTPNSDLIVNSHYYIVQEEYSNYRKYDGNAEGCVLGNANTTILQGTTYQTYSSAVSGVNTQWSVKALNTNDGTIRWTNSAFATDAGTSLTGIYGPAQDATSIGATGNIYYNGTGIGIYGVNGKTGKNVPYAPTGLGNVVIPISNTTAYAPAVDPVFGYIIFSTTDGIVYAYKPDSTSVWSYALPVGVTANSAPFITAGNVYISGTDGRIYNLKVNPTSSAGQSFGSYAMPTGYNLTSPLGYRSGTLYFGANNGTTSKVYALTTSATTAPTLKWTYTAAAKVILAPVASATGVFVINQFDGTYVDFNALSLTTGVSYAQIQSLYNYAGVDVDSSYVYVGTTNGYYSYSQSNLALHTSTNTGNGNFYGKPTFAANTVIIGHSDPSLNPYVEGMTTTGTGSGTARYSQAIPKSTTNLDLLVSTSAF